MNTNERSFSLLRRAAVGLALGALISWSDSALADESEPRSEAATSPSPAAGPAHAAAPRYPYPPQPNPPAPGYAPAPPQRQPPVVVYDWDPDVPAPRGYEMDSDVNWGLIGGGIALLAAGWGISLLTATVAISVEEQEEEDEDPSQWDDIHPSDWTPLYIPVVGPFMAIGTLKASGSGIGFLVADGILQTAGVLGIVLGAVDQEYKLIRTGQRTAVEIQPAVAGGSGGLSVTGSF